MKVVLLKNVPKLGGKYDIKDVSDGFALNYLIPNGAAVAATEREVKKMEDKKLKDVQVKKVKENILLKNLKDLSNAVVELSCKANDKGHLFAGIHKDDLVPELMKQAKLDIDAEYIVLEESIKQTGEYTIPVKVGDKEASFKLVVSSNS